MKKQARQRGYEVLGEISPSMVLPYTGPEVNDQYYFGRMVKMTSLRYQTFKQSRKCVCCGIVGTTMLLELPKGGKRPHFNLYAEREGTLVQMTKDHKKPRSRGGKDCIGNLQTMCCRCNELKGNQGTKLKRLREIQDGVQTVYTVTCPSGHTLNKFATSHKGLSETVRRFLRGGYDWYEDSIEVQVSTRQKLIRVQTPGGEMLFNINAIERV